MSANQRSFDHSDFGLNRVLTEYLEVAEQGGNVTADHWAQRFPEYADDLREFIEGHQRLNAVVAAAGAGGEATLAASDCRGSSSTKIPRVRYFGDYELQEEIARGGMGVVYRGRQVSLNRPVAVKMILSGELASPDDVDRFRLEAEAAANLDHPGIVPIYEIGESKGQHYFSMKYIAGESLASRLKQQTPAITVAPVNRDEVRGTVRLVAEVARAVHYAHQRGIIHRDLKPANILIDADGRPHVTDFGLAKRTTGDSQLTRTGAIVGTPSYMSPEQAAGDTGAITTATDIHGLGTILYAALTGHAPFDGADPLETLQRVRSEIPRKLSSVSSHFDRDLDSVCAKCLAKNPDDRYRSAGELADDLERWLNGDPVMAAPPNVATLLWRWLSGNLRVAAAVLMLGGVTGWLVAEPFRMTQAHNVGSYLGVYRSSFPSLQPPALLRTLGEYPNWLGGVLFLIGLASFLSLGWFADWLIRPKATATAVVTGLAIGGTAAVTAFFGGVGWTTVSQQAVWPVHADLELLAATIDNETSYSDGHRVTDTYPGVSARRVMKKALADLESRIPLAMGFGLLSSFQLLLLPAIVQSLAAYLLRQRGDPPGQRFTYLLELSIPLTLVLGGAAYLFYQQPWLIVSVPAVGIIAWMLIEFTRRWSVRSRRAVGMTFAVAVILGVGLAANFALLQSGWPFPGGKSPALYLVGAATAIVAVLQRWPAWRYVVYAIWAASLLSTFTGPAWSIPTSPEEIAASVRNSHAGTLLVLALTGLGTWYCSTPTWKQQRAARIAANSTPTALARRRILMKRWTMIGVVGVLVAGAMMIPIIQRQLRHQQLVKAMDRMQPDSIPEIKRLVAQGADIRSQGTDNTVVMVAAYWNDPQLLRQALDAGANVNAADSFGNTALHFATFAPSLEPMRLLLAAGAKVNVQNERGQTPLMGAVRNAQFDQVKLLLEAGANVELVAGSGETALSIATTLKPSGPRPIRPDLTADDFVRLLQSAPKAIKQ